MRQENIIIFLSIKKLIIDYDIKLKGVFDR